MFGGSEIENSRAERDLLELATRSAHIGISSFTADGPFIRSVEHDRIFGVEPGAHFDLKILLDFFHPEDREFIQGEIEAALAGKRTTINVEHRIIRKDGATRWVNAFGQVQTDRKSNQIRVILGVIDITDRKKLEEDREMFVATLTHDLRNPLGAVRAHAELLLRYLDQIQDRQDSLLRIVSNNQRADQMIQDLLDVTRIRAGERLNLERRECDLQRELQESIDEFTMRYGDRFRFVASGDFRGTWACHGIRRAMENLVENAVKYGGTGTPITVSLSREREVLYLSVKNEGNLIPPEEQKGILAPFRRAKQVEGSKTKGWGLGLTVVRSVVEELGGSLQLQSTESTGTIFKIQVPIITGAPDATY